MITDDVITNAADHDRYNHWGTAAAWQQADRSAAAAVRRCVVLLRREQAEEARERIAAAGAVIAAIAAIGVAALAAVGVVAAAGRVIVLRAGHFVLRDHVVLGVGDLAVAHPEPLGEGALAAVGNAGAAGKIDRQGNELLLRFRRRRSERRLLGVHRPRRLDDLLEDRHRHAAAGLAAAKRAPLALVVVADPDADRHVIGEADEPGIVLVVAGAGLAADIGGELADRARRAARHHALENGAQLEERRTVAAGEPLELGLVGVDRVPALLDQFDAVGRGPPAFGGDRGVGCGHVDQPRRLGAEHEGIVGDALRVDLRIERELAHPGEALARVAVDAAVEEVGGDEVLRVLEAAPQRADAAAIAFVVLRRPVVALPRVVDAAADRRQRDLLVAHEGVRLQSRAQRREIGKRLDRGAGLALRLRGAVELARRVGEAADHGEDGARLVVEDDGRALHPRPHPQLDPAGALAAGIALLHEHDVIGVDAAPHRRRRGSPPGRREVRLSRRSCPIRE